MDAAASATGDGGGAASRQRPARPAVGDAEPSDGGFAGVAREDAEVADRIIAFLTDIGIAVTFGDVPPGTFLPGIAVRDGGLVVDRDRLAWPGDLLHEAGHIAVTDPALRPTLSAVGEDPAEEMATFAWSYAAATAIGVPAAVVFHAGGYDGGGDWVVAAFANGGQIGAPMLHYWGMSGPVAPTAPAERPYPHMHRWLR